MQLVLFALFFVASTFADLAVIDVYPLVMGLHDVPPMTESRIWMEAKTFTIDFDKVDLPDDHLWEATAYSSYSVYGINDCKWSIGYVHDGNNHEVRSGSISSGGFDTDYFVPVTSSAVLFVRGSEVPPAASHLYFTVDNCDFGRYITRSQFGEWHGQAYLLDFSGNKYIRAGWSDEVGRLGDFEYVSGDGNWPIFRDNSMFQRQAGFWSDYFFFDYTQFANLTNPVLDFWFYSDSYSNDYVYFYLCDYDVVGGVLCDDKNDYYVSYNSEIYYEYENMDSGYIHVYFDIKASIQQGTGSLGADEPYGADPYHTTALYLSGYAAGAPYAKIWDFRTTNPDRVNGNPQLLDLTSKHVSWTGDCEYDGYGSYEDMYIDGPGLPHWSCSNADGASVSWNLPSSVSHLVNPWMLWTDYVEAAANSDTQVAYRMINAETGLVLRDYAIYPAYSEIHKMWDTQISLGQWSYKGGETFVVQQQADAFYFLGIVPLYSGSENYCVGTPCGDHGACYNWYFGYKCVCQMGWEGEVCDMNVDDCPGPQFATCLNGGMCHDLDNAYECKCADGWTGSRCETAEDWCPQDHCLNGGKCVSGVARRFTCDCTGTGFSGKWCEHDDNNCHSDPYGCGEYGTCVSAAAGKYTCDCHDGWTGAWCDVPEVCEPNPCQNGGSCWVWTAVGKAPVAQCTCTANFFGEWCAETFAEFEDDCRYAGSCMNGGVCTDKGAIGFRCECDVVNWSGTWCEVSTKCDPNPCQNEGECEVMNGKAVCWCAANFFGNYCEDTIVEHMHDCRYAGSCQHNGVCRDDQTRGVFRCTCPTGWTGDFCEISTSCHPNPCQNQGECSWFQGKAICTCPGLYFGDFCEDRLPVFESDCRYNGPCENGGVCNDNNQAGVFRCVCDALHWKGDFCEVSQKCSKFPCENNGECMIVNDNPVCVCTSDHFGDKCQHTVKDFVKDCRFSSGCENGGVCNDNAVAGEFRCRCLSGWTGDWCEVNQACMPNPCKNGGECYTTATGVACSCPGSYFGDFCTDTLADFSKDCRFSGSCVNGKCNDNQVSGTFRCVCETGWTGEWCNESTLCSVNPCLHGGVCEVVNGKAACLCPGNYYGETCQNSLDTYFGDCGASCQNGGTCSQVANVGWQCQCGPNWTGQYCDTPKVCVTNPCKNDGACRLGSNGQAYCICPGGFSGPQCENSLDSWFRAQYSVSAATCGVNFECMNGGSCVNGVCVCASGYFGNNCASPTACSPNPCGVAGICDVVDGSVVCYCAAGTIGDRCQWALDDFLVPDCRFNHCQNGGTCNLVGSKYVCACTKNWSGEWCELSSHCEPSPCNNGAECSFAGESPACSCNGDTYGPTCNEQDLKGTFVDGVEKDVSNQARKAGIRK